MTTSIERDAERARRGVAHERWLRAAAPGARALRWLQGPGQWAANTALYRLAESLKLDATARLLDIGCGRGSVLRTLDDQLHLDVPPVGIDLSRETLALAQRDEDNPRRGAGLLQGSALSLPLRDGAFSAVTCGYVLHRLDDDEARALFYEIGRVLEPGGLAVLWDFGPTGNAGLDAWNARVIAAGAPAGAPPPRLRSAQTLRRLATEVGFPFTHYADLRPFLLPPIPRASLMVGRPPDDFDLSRL